MNCCGSHTSSARRFFGWMAKLYARRYRRKGLDNTQRLLLEELVKSGVGGKSLLEIGCGVGVLHQTLLERGASSAVGVDLSDEMLDHARQRATELTLEERVSYERGDFVETRDHFDPADITLLDKVVCCYPAPKQLLEAAASKTRVAVALTYPRKHPLGLFFTAIWNLAFWLARSDFRSFVHEPYLIRQWLNDKGLRQSYGRDTFWWHSEVYVIDAV